MSKRRSKHTEELIGIVTDFQGGLNLARPPHSIEDNELIEATNFYYDPSSGYLRSRPGLIRHSASAAPAKINSIYAFDVSSTTVIVFSCEDQKLYKLDGSLDPLYIGDLLGSGVPSYAELNNKLVIATGASLQIYDGSTLASAGSPNMSIVASYGKKDSARIIGSDGGDKVYLSGIADPTNWTTDGVESNAFNFDLGYKDGLDIVGLESYRGRLFVFKRKKYGNVYKGQSYVCNLEGKAIYWTAIEWIKTSALTQRHIHEINSQLFYVAKTGTWSADVTEKFADYIISPFGQKIDSVLKQYLSDTGFTILDSNFGILMIKPQKDYATFYCFDYMGQRWTTFEFDVNVLCGIFADTQMLFGCDDYYIYKYDGDTYQDNAVNYPIVVETKYFNQIELMEELTKEKFLDVVGHADGVLQWSIYINGALKYTKEKTFGSGWWSWAVVNALEEPVNVSWDEELIKTTYDTLRDDNVTEGDLLSFRIQLSSGLASLANVKGRITASGRN